jgi:phosphatidylethanolamine/phosphatidyl-N-methylethanolamine N-methyltransferase
MMNESEARRPGGPSALSGANINLAPFRDSLEFLRGFVRNPAQVGSVIPSSRQLEKRLVSSAHIAEARTVVELGPGTGGTTNAFLKAMAPGARLLAIELDHNFHRLLSTSIPDPRLVLECGSAERIAEYLETHRLPAPDAIVSGIPFSTMPPEVSDAIAARVAEVLRPGGRFVAYQVRAHVADYVSPYLGEPAMAWEIVNIPPVRVFTWVKPES